MQNTKNSIIQLIIYKLIEKIKKILLFLSLFFFLFSNAQAKSITGTITELLKKKQNLKCTYQVLDKDQKLKGIMYLSKNKFRSEFKTKINNQTINTFSLSDGQWLYNWTDNHNMGSKINLKQAQQLEKQTKTASTDQNLKEVKQQLKTEYKLNCQKFSPKKGFLKPPKQIQFTDLGQMMQGLKQIQKNACGICNNLPEQAKQACLQSCK